MKITWFGHSAFRVDYEGAVVMIDPFLSNPTFKGDRKEAARGTTHVIVTHGHSDHTGSAAEICRDQGATLISNPEICSFLAKHGVEKAEPINHGGELDLGAFSIAWVPAWHSSASDDGTYLGNPAGVVLMAKGEKTLFHMGDTGIFEGMGLTAELYQPAIGIVPVGDRFTMGGRIAAIACKRYFNFETVIPCHYGTFGLIEPTADKFVEGMKDSATRVLVMERGVAEKL